MLLNQSVEVIARAMSESEPLVEPKTAPVSGKCALQAPMMDAVVPRKRRAATTHCITEHAWQHDDCFAMGVGGRGEKLIDQPTLFRQS